MNYFHQAIALAGMSITLNCAAQSYPLTFDVEHAYYGTFLKSAVGDEGRLSCAVTIEENRRGEKWVPSVILAAAQDPAEDDTLFLSGYKEADSDQTVFDVRTLNAAKPMIGEYFFRAADAQGQYTLNLAWHKDGSITYQVASGEAQSTERIVQSPGFKVRHVSVHASGVKGRALCQLTP